MKTGKLQRHVACTTHRCHGTQVQLRRCQRWCTPTWTACLASQVATSCRLSCSAWSTSCFVRCCRFSSYIQRHGLDQQGNKSSRAQGHCGALQEGLLVLSAGSRTLQVRTMACGNLRQGEALSKIRLIVNDVQTICTLYKSMLTGHTPPQAEPAAAWPTMQQSSGAAARVAWPQSGLSAPAASALLQLHSPPPAGQAHTATLDTSPRQHSCYDLICMSCTLGG